MRSEAAQVVDALEETESFLLGLQVDMDRERIYLETRTTMMPDTAAAAAWDKADEAALTVAAAKTGDGKAPAISFHHASAVPPEARATVAAGLEQALSDDGGDATAGAILALLRDLAGAMLDAGSIDAALTVDTSGADAERPLPDVTVGMRIKDGPALEKKLKDALGSADALPPNVAVKFDAGRSGAANLHEVVLTMKDVPEAERFGGKIALTLAVLAAVGVRRRDVGWWSGVAVTSTLFSLGPFLYVTSEVRLPWKFPPYMWMYDWFPFFSQVSIPFRFNVVALLALATLTAYGLAHWLRARPLIDRGLIAATLSLAILIEVMYVSPAPFPVPLASRAVPVALQRLAADPVPGGLLDIPVQRFEGELLPGEYFYYQTVHGKSIPNRVEGEIPIYVFKNRFMLQLFHLEHDWPGYPNDTETALKKSLEELRDFKFRYIVLHENLLRAGASARLHGLLDHFLGAPRIVDGAITVYDVGGKS